MDGELVFMSGDLSVWRFGTSTWQVTRGEDPDPAADIHRQGGAFALVIRTNTSAHTSEVFATFEESLQALRLAYGSPNTRPS